MIAALVASLLFAAAGEGQTSVVLRWKPVEGAVFYDLEIATDPEFKDVVLTMRLSQSGYRWEALPDRVCYFRARGLDEKEQAGPWSEVKEIAPVFVTPALTRPKRGQAFAGGNGPERVEFHFEPKPLFATYRLEVSDDPAFTSPQVEESAASPIIFVAKALGTHSYRFSAKTADGKTTKPLEGTFTIVLPAPEPLLIDGAIVTAGQSAPLAWTKVRGAVAYRVQVSSNKDSFKPDLMNERTTATELAFPTTKEGTYAWRVSAEDDRGRRYAPSPQRTLQVAARLPTAPASAPAAPPPFLSLRLGLAHTFGYNFVRSASLGALARADVGFRMGPGRLLVELSFGFVGYDASREPGAAAILAFPFDPSLLYELEHGVWRFHFGAVLALRPLQVNVGALIRRGGAAVGVGGAVGFGYAWKRLTLGFELRIVHALLVDPAVTLQTGGLNGFLFLTYDVL